MSAVQQFREIQSEFPSQVKVEKLRYGRLERYADQPHTGLTRGSITFLHVAAATGRDYIGPVIGAVTSPGDHMVYGQLRGRKLPPTVLTRVAVSDQDVSS